MTWEREINNIRIGQRQPREGSFTILKAATDPTNADGVGDRGYNDARYSSSLDIIRANASIDTLQADVVRSNASIDTLQSNIINANASIVINASNIIRANASINILQGLAIGVNASTGRFGNAIDYLNIDSGGIVTLHGDARRYLTLRPPVDTVHQIAKGKPTQVNQGVFFGYSMPVFNDDDEELFFKARVPYRWDGESDFVFDIYVWLSGAEDVGDNFKFQAAWENHTCDTIVPATSNNVLVEQAVLISRNAQYSCYMLSLTVDYDIDGEGNEIKKGDNFAINLRRLDATNPDVSNEIVVYGWNIKYRINELYGSW